MDYKEALDGYNKAKSDLMNAVTLAEKAEAKDRYARFMQILSELKAAAREEKAVVKAAKPSGYVKMTPQERADRTSEYTWLKKRKLQMDFYARIAASPQWTRGSFGQMLKQFCLDLVAQCEALQPGEAIPTYENTVQLGDAVRPLWSKKYDQFYPDGKGGYAPNPDYDPNA